MRFEILHQSTKSKARVGKIHTPHGIIHTPGFVAVGTNGTIKTLDSNKVHEIGLELMFCNTYHLLLEPGTEVVRQAGGLHSFMNRSLPIITDSGGFQVFSLAYGSIASELKSAGKKLTNGGCVVKIDEDGIIFRSYRDGKKLLLSPESSILAQKAFGADIIIPLDELPPYHIAAEGLKEAFDRTHRWEKRSLDTHLQNPQEQAIFAVIHGGVDRELRKKSAEILTLLPFDGFAIGGSMGKTKREMADIVNWTRQHLPDAFPSHLLGIADLESVTACIPFGIDTFDSSYPTKAARHGLLFTKQGPIKIGTKRTALHFGPIEHGCRCPTCQHYSLAYVGHLFRTGEVTAQTLASVHNLYFMVKFMETMRQKIYENVV